VRPAATLAAVLDADREARAVARERIAGRTAAAR
jgi:hypothetical protein